MLLVILTSRSANGLGHDLIFLTTLLARVLLLYTVAYSKKTAPYPPSFSGLPEVHVTP